MKNKITTYQEMLIEAISILSELQNPINDCWLNTDCKHDAKHLKKYKLARKLLSNILENDNLMEILGINEIVLDKDNVI
jgi:hypothetical protein